MFIVWRGTGIFVPVVFLAVFIFLPNAMRIVFEGESGIDKITMMYISSGVCALILAILGYFMNYRYRIVTENVFLKKPQKSPSHTFIFVQVEYWALIIPAVIYGLSHGASLP